MSKITRRRLLSSSAIAALLAAGRAEARVWGGQAVLAMGQAIVSVTPPSASFIGGTGSAGTIIATAAATMSPALPDFTGTWSLSGTNAASFTINSSTGVLAVGASDVSNGTYNVNIVATQPGATGSPFAQACTITGSSAVAITSHDVFNAQIAVTAVNKPYMFGQGFRMGDIPAGTQPVVAGLTTQIDEISPAYPDGSMRHCVITTVPASVASGTAARLQINRISGTYSPPSTPRSVSEITSGHAFKLQYQEVVDHLNATVGSGNFSFDVNAAIAAGPITTVSQAKGYEVHWNGPLLQGIKVVGYFVDDAGGTSPTLYCEWYFELYSDPANTANLLYIEHMPFMSQPPMDTHGTLDLMVGRCIVKDGATTLRDFGAEGFSAGPSDIIGANSGDARVSAAALARSGWNIQDNEAFKLTLQPGAGNALPAGLVAGNPYWILVPTPGLSNGHLSPDGRISINSNVTDVGTAGGGTPTPFVFMARQLVNNYQGIFLPSDNLGTPWRTNSSWADFEVSLDKFDGGTAQKSYWQATGIVPGWDLSLGATLPKMDFAALTGDSTKINGGGPLYRPATHGPYSSAIGGGSTNYDYGDFCEWDARWFARMGVSNWSRSENQMVRCQALTAAALPLTQFHRVAYPRKVIVNNNGPQNNSTPPYTSGSGGQYTGLGPSDPNMFWVASGSAGIDLPVGAGNGWHNAPFQASSNPVSDHWPITCIWQYAFFGKRYFRDQLDRQANHQLICNAIDAADAGPGVLNVTWQPGTQSGMPVITNAAANYTFYSKMTVGGQERSDMGITTVMAASVLGDATRPAQARWQDYQDATFLFWDYWYNQCLHQGGTDADPGIKTTGIWLWARLIAEPWMMQGYGAICYAFCRNLTRHAKAHIPVDACATNWALYWSGVANVPEYFIPAYYRYYGGRQFAPDTPPGGYARGTIWPTTQQCFNGYDGFSLGANGIFTRVAVGGGFGDSDSPNTQANTNPMTLGDEVMIITGLSQFDHTTYTGPPEYNPDVIYYACQVGNAGANTFRLSTTADGLSPITVSASFGTISLGIRFHGYNPAPGSGTGFLVGGQNTVENGGYAMSLGSAYEMRRGGAPAMGNAAINFNLAITKAQAWYQMPSTQAISPSGSGFRFRLVDTVTVV